MRTTPSQLLGSLGLLALLGCSGSHESPHSVSGYLVNGIAVADIDANGIPDILGLVSIDVDGAPAQSSGGVRGSQRRLTSRSQ